MNEDEKDKWWMRMKKISDEGWSNLLSRVHIHRSPFQGSELASLHHLKEKGTFKFNFYSSISIRLPVAGVTIGIELFCLALQCRNTPTWVVNRDCHCRLLEVYSWSGWYSLIGVSSCDTSGTASGMTGQDFTRQDTWLNDQMIKNVANCTHTGNHFVNSTMTSSIMSIGTPTQSWEWQKIRLGIGLLVSLSYS
jgi:hypothetical protein